MKLPNLAPSLRILFRRLAAAFTIAALAGCAADPGSVDLSKALTDSPLVATILNPDKLSPETKGTLAERNLTRTYRRDPAAAVAALDADFRKNPSAALRLSLAELCTDTAESMQAGEPMVALGYHLAAAEYAFPAVTSGNPSAMASDPLLAIYNHSSGRVAQILFEQHRDWRKTIPVKGPLHDYRLRSRTTGRGYMSPALVDELTLAEYVEVKGFAERNTVTGVGSTLVGHRDFTEARRASEPLLSPAGMELPITATLDFSGGGSQVELAFHDVLVVTEARVAGRTVTLAADYTAPIAYLENYAPPKNIGFKGLTHPDKYMSEIGLYQLEPFRKDQIPLLYVHGLMSSPETWVTALNHLRADPVIRENYQPLVYLYPTGYPISYNLSGLRKRLHEAHEIYDPGRTNPYLRRTVIIGHSMGGNLTNAQIRSSGDILWDKFFTVPIDETGFTPQQREIAEELLFFDAAPGITRAVFICAPHRGSKIADDFVGRLGTRLIKFSDNFLPREDLPEIPGMTEAAHGYVSHPTDSIDDLEIHSDVLETMLELPINERVTYHSIIGKADDKPLEESSDLVVPYWSATLEGAASEKIVPANHVQATGNAETIEEIRRILYLHIGAPYTPRPAIPPEKTKTVGRKKRIGPLSRSGGRL